MNPIAPSKLIRLLFSAGCLLALGASGSQGQEIVNGDFEGSFQPVKIPGKTKSKIDGEVADGWRDESAWGEVSLAYSQDVKGGHEKGSAQKIEVRAIDQGGVQFVQELKFKEGSTYHLTAWVKAAEPGEVTLMLRQSGVPYTTYGITKAQVTTDWTQVEVSGPAPADENGLVIFQPTAPGTYWIDDVIFEAK